MAVPATLLTLGRENYSSAWELQRALVQDRLNDRIRDTLILLEHDPVFTIGRRGRKDHCDEERLLKAGYPVYYVERGGSVTYHGPGQIVGYPILCINRFCAGPKAYMRLLEEVVIRTLAQWGMVGRRMERLTGVWVDQEKISAMGVRLIRGVTMHGFALNVTIDLEPFAQIIPCGLSGCRVTSMERLLKYPLDIQQVRRQVAKVFADVFGLEWTDQGAAHETTVTGSAPRTIEPLEKGRHSIELGIRRTEPRGRNYE